ncbi:MAG: hypothetical protein COU71_02930 [Parcubacteria group bacterium CG10_big_fil_rev_8_21_14_0_10_38_31]|nr:MAG: hypothetical protein COU71_02930 [Parcubacteria group bacterium CG10_big_fil_rev_8_21_14_0_10_38_31]
MNELEKEIKEISPVLIIKYKNNLDRYFSSMNLFWKIYASVGILGSLFFLAVGFFYYSGPFEKFTIVFSLAVAVVIVFKFYIPKQIKIFQYKVVLGKDEIILFRARLPIASRRVFFMPREPALTYHRYFYSNIKGYEIKPSEIYIEIYKDKFKGGGFFRIPWFYIGGLSKSEIGEVEKILENKIYPKTSLA